MCLSKWPSCLWLIAGWNWGFESRWGNGYLSLCVVCCQLQISETGPYLVHRIPIDCHVSLCATWTPHERGGPGLRWADAPEGEKNLMFTTTTTTYCNWAFTQFRKQMILNRNARIIPVIMRMKFIFVSVVTDYINLVSCFVQILLNGASARFLCTPCILYE